VLLPAMENKVVMSFSWNSGCQTFCLGGPLSLLPNRYGPFRFVNVFSIIGKLDLVAS